MPLITLLDPAGSGQPYVRPIARGSYITLPLGLWSSGWILDMPATSLALVMIISDLQRGRNEFRYTYQHERDAYGLSVDTWTRGRHYLEPAGILEVRRLPQGGDFDYRRMRNLYRINRDRLATPPAWTN